jgi:xanthine dehydrogenase YagR molybdenum-binding subunit
MQGRIGEVRLVPTNADIPELDVLFVGEFDEEASPLGAKGLGELTVVSVAPAIANAVYHATAHARARPADHAE